MLYFAYGSNMSLARLRARVPSAEPLGCHKLEKHRLKFHKVSRDGSGKCDAFFTNNPQDIIYGVVFKICPSEKKRLDEAEELGIGYDEKPVTLTDLNGNELTATTYFAIRTQQDLKPYSWYLQHVLTGAKEMALPDHYIHNTLLAVATVDDENTERDRREREIHHNTLNTASEAPLDYHQNAVRTVENDPAYLTDFVRLNEAWIQHYFELEEADKQLAANPHKIIDDGGYIFYVLEGYDVRGVCALLNIGDGIYELAKMAVSPEHQGKGYGDQLMSHCIDKLTKLSAKQVYLVSNTKLIAALALYKKYGFTTVADVTNHLYARANIKMSRFFNEG